MKRSIQTSLALALLFMFLLPLPSLARQKGENRVQTGSVTGTYRYVLNTVEVLELPDHKVRIAFWGVWPNDRKRVETRNTGSFDETVPLKGRRAIVKPRDGDDDCAITLDFKAAKVILTEEGYRCGFGFNVEADGTYIRVSSKPPDLPAPKPDQDKQQDDK